MDNHGFASVGGLRVVDIGPADRPWAMYVSAKSNFEYEIDLINLLKEI